MRHKKIPGKKHKGYKDPEVQHAKRNEQLSQKVGSKQIPYNFTQIIFNQDLCLSCKLGFQIIFRSILHPMIQMNKKCPKSSAS